MITANVLSLVHTGQPANHTSKQGCFLSVVYNACLATGVRLPEQKVSIIKITEIT